MKRYTDLEATHSSAAVAAALRRQAVDRPKMRRPRPKADPIANVTITLEGQLVDIAGALVSLEGARSRRSVLQSIVEDALWSAYSRSAVLRRHVAVRMAGRAEGKKNRPSVDDLYDPV